MTTTLRSWLVLSCTAPLLFAACGDSVRKPAVPDVSQPGAPGASTGGASAQGLSDWVVIYDPGKPRAPAAHPQVPPAVLDAESRIPTCSDGAAGPAVVDDVIDGDFLGTGTPVQAVLVNRRKTVGQSGAAGSEMVQSALVLHTAGSVLFATRIPEALSFGGIFRLPRPGAARDGFVLLSGQAGGGVCTEAASFVEVSANAPVELRKVDGVANCMTSPAGCQKPKGRIVEIRRNQSLLEFRESPIPWAPGDPCSATQPPPASSGGAVRPPPPAHS